MLASTSIHHLLFPSPIHRCYLGSMRSVNSSEQPHIITIADSNKLQSINEGSRFRITLRMVRIIVCGIIVGYGILQTWAILEQESIRLQNKVFARKSVFYCFIFFFAGQLCFQLPLVFPCM